MGSARTVLDQVHSLAKVDELAREPGRYARAVADDLVTVSAGADLPGIEARDHALASALAHIDAAMTRVMRVRLDHALASDASADAAIAVPTRNVFASTLGKYAGDLGLLGERVRDLAARGRARDPGAVATLVVDAARATLDLRDALRAPVLDLVGAYAGELAPVAQRTAIDRTRSDSERKRWSALRRDLELLVSKPEHISSAPLAERLAAWDEQIDEPPPEPDVSFADMIELD